jgi:serine/threonine protein kinase
MSNERETVAKLSDFGVAKYVYASSRYLNTTIAGTQQFMAPEVQFQTGHSTNADVSLTKISIVKRIIIFIGMVIWYDTFKCLCW